MQVALAVLQLHVQVLKNRYKNEYTICLGHQLTDTANVSNSTYGICNGLKIERTIGLLDLMNHNVRSVV